MLNLGETNVLVIGAGVCGIQSSLDLADMGFNVYLVEKNPSIGGHMAQLDKTFPTLDCSACILTPKMVDVARHPNINLLTYSEVKEISKDNSFEVTILKKPRYIEEEKCTGCGICAQHCPIEVTSEFDMGLGIRKAVYVPFPQAIPLVFTIDKEHCIDCGLCEKMCEAGAVNHDQQPVDIKVKVESIIVATGFHPFDARKKGEYGYGIYDNVYTGLEFERLLSAGGPTGGHLARLSDGRIPKKIAFIQCVGSRDEKVGNLNCSRVCCMYSTKQAILAKEHVHGVDIQIFYSDIRAYGKGFEEFYRRAEDEFGVKFIRGFVSEIVENPETKNLLLRVEDTETEELVEREFDMVVLSTGLWPTKDAEIIEKIFSLPRREDGFFAPADLQLSSVVTPTGGIYIAGAAEGPKDIPDSISQASAAAMKASMSIVKISRGGISND
ncbi:MAG: CoB--CoM heterodisulfide reductase iron-sulfur subunit A family protein [Candidatus Bathyarchaeia archaeon]